MRMIINKRGDMMLFDELKLRSGETIKNRFFKSAMSEVLSKDGNPNDQLVNLYRVWNDNEIGLMVSGNVMIDRTALGEPSNVILDNKSNREAFVKWSAIAKKDKSAFWLQLNHPGKQAPRFLNSYSLAPSAIPYEGSMNKLFAKPKEMKEEDIYGIIAKFADASRLAKEYGFTGVQIHAAHGYLISQFLSSRYNKRKDMWGGCLENRARFLLEIYKAVRKSVGNKFSVGVKINSSDFQDDGFTEEESIQVIKWLDELGIDLIEISGGNYEKSVFTEEIQGTEGFFRSFSKKAKGVVKAPVVLTGGIRSAEFMEEQLRSGITDMIGIGRPFVSTPDLIKRIMQNKSFKINIEKQKTGIKSVDSLGLISLSWYEAQMHYISETGKPKDGLSLFRALVKVMKKNGLKTFKRRRI